MVPHARTSNFLPEVAATDDLLRRGQQPTPRRAPHSLDGVGAWADNIMASQRREAMFPHLGTFKARRFGGPFFAPPPSVAKHRTARTGTQKGSKGFGQDRQLRLSPRQSCLSQIQRYAPQVKPSYMDQAGATACAPVDCGEMRDRYLLTRSATPTVRRRSDWRQWLPTRHGAAACRLAPW